MDLYKWKQNYTFKIQHPKNGSYNGTPKLIITKYEINNTIITSQSKNIIKQTFSSYTCIKTLKLEHGVGFAIVKHDIISISSWK